MSLEDIKELKRQFKVGYRASTELLDDLFNNKYDKNGYTPTPSKTRMDALNHSATGMEELGRAVGWYSYHLKHPIKASKYRKSQKYKK